MVVTVGTDMLAKAMQTTRAGEARGTALDQGTTALYRMSDDVRQTSSVLEPNYATLAQGSPFIVLQTQNSTTVAYRTAADPTQPQQQVLERFLYEPGFPTTQVVVRDSTRYLTSAPTVVWFAAGPTFESSTLEMHLVVTPPGAYPVGLSTKKTPWVNAFAGL
ncbi:MAG TPA: hypothetical protein VGO93_15205 [Candidatus Xenobia bacterium]|jgi:hypothetical protein